MDLNKELRRFNLIFGIPLFFIIILFLTFKISIIAIIVFLSSYTWLMAIKAPGVKEKIKLHKYRYSFLKYINLLDDFIKRKIKFPVPPIIITSITPLVVISILSLMISIKLILFVLIGILLFWNLDRFVYKNS